MAKYPLYSVQPGSKNLFANLDYLQATSFKNYQDGQYQFWDAYTNWGV